MKLKIFATIILIMNIQRCYAANGPATKHAMPAQQPQKPNELSASVASLDKVSTAVVNAFTKERKKIKDAIYLANQARIKIKNVVNPLDMPLLETTKMEEVD